MINLNIVNINELLGNANIALGIFKKDFSRVVARAVNRTTDGFRTDAVKESSRKYFLKSREIRDSIEFKKASPENLFGAIISSGKRRNIANFALTPKTPRYKRDERGRKRQIPPMGAVRREGGMKSLGKETFLMRRAGGKYFPFVRTGKRKYEMRSFISPSIPQIISNRETVEIMERNAEERFTKRLDHEILRVLGALP